MKPHLTALQSVTCHIGSQCYLPPNTSEQPCLKPSQGPVLDLLIP